MRLERAINGGGLERRKEGDEVNHSHSLDYIDCGEFYLLVSWINSGERAVTLSQKADLRDLQEKHGGRISYSKFCKTTFRLYESEEGENWSHDIKEVMHWTRVDPYDKYHSHSLLLEALVLEEGLGKLNLADRIMRWPKENGGKGASWYTLRTPVPAKPAPVKLAPVAEQGLKGFFSQSPVSAPKQRKEGFFSRSWGSAGSVTERVNVLVKRRDLLIAELVEQGGSNSGVGRDISFTLQDLCKVEDQLKHLSLTNTQGKENTQVTVNGRSVKPKKFIRFLVGLLIVIILIV
jgi:hypothetical protein